MSGDTAIFDARTGELRLSWALAAELRRREMECKRPGDGESTWKVDEEKWIGELRDLLGAELVSAMLDWAADSGEPVKMICVPERRRF